MINKEQVWQQLFAQLTTLIDVAKAAAKRAHDTATDDENVAENKYDTLGLEAAYLAQGQQARVLQCQDDLEKYRALQNQYHGDGRVKPGCVVTLLDESEQLRHFLVGVGAGGVKLEVENSSVLVITPAAPLGRALMGLQVDDEVSLTIGGNQIDYEVTAVN